MNPFLYNLRIKITFSSLLKSLVENIMKKMIRTEETQGALGRLSKRFPRREPPRSR